MARAKGRRPLGAASAPASAPEARPGWTAPRKALLLAGIVTALLLDDRQAGKIGDALQMIRPAVSLATTGEIGVSRDIQRDAVARQGGDATSRYGIGMTIAQVPAAVLAPVAERAFGPGASQTLFCLAPFAFGLLAAWAAGRIAAALGAGERGQAMAVLLASLGSPLGAYAAVDLSESLQAAALATALAFSLGARRERAARAGLRRAVAAGFAAGIAVLTKPALVAVAPFALLPLLARAREATGAGIVARAAAAAGGAIPVLAAAAWLEVSRFGSLFGGYEGLGFTYPFLLGAVQLLLGPVKGLVLFFPALLAAVVEAARRMRSGEASAMPGEPAARRLEAAAALLPLAALLAIAASWWAWSGVAGWGPRLLVPGLPGAAALAAVLLERWPARRARAFVGGSIALNALGLLQSPVPVFLVTGRLASTAVPPEIARRFVPVPESAGGGPVLVNGSLLIHEQPLASDFVTHAWLLRVRAVPGPAARARLLDAPPWISARPDLRPVHAPHAPPVAAALAPPLSPGFLGRSLLLRGEDPARGDAYGRALADQVLRAQQQRRLDRALRLATLLWELGPRRDSAALLAESYRLLGRHETLRAFLESIPPEVGRTAPVYAVLALAARDVGETEAARAYLERAAGLGAPGVKRALESDVGGWPPDFATLLAAPGGPPVGPGRTAN